MVKIPYRRGWAYQIEEAGHCSVRQFHVWLRDHYGATWGVDCDVDGKVKDFLVFSDERRAVEFVLKHG